MLFNGTIKAWSRTHHGPRVQARAIMFIASKIDDLEAFGCMEYSMDSIYQQCKDRCTPDVSVLTLYRWWQCYLEWGKLPHVVRRKKDVAD